MTPSRVNFRDIARDYGQIYTIVYKTLRQGEKELTFAPIVPIENGMRCGSCGRSEWNATNLHNRIHFCPDRELHVFKSPFRITPN